MLDFLVLYELCLRASAFCATHNFSIVVVCLTMTTVLLCYFWYPDWLPELRKSVNDTMDLIYRLSFLCDCRTNTHNTYENYLKTKIIVNCLHAHGNCGCSTLSKMTMTTDFYFLLFYNQTSRLLPWHSLTLSLEIYFPISFFFIFFLFGTLNAAPFIWSENRQNYPKFPIE